MPRRHVALTLALALALAGCARDAPHAAPEDPAAADFRMEGGWGWRAPVVDAEGVDVRVQPASDGASVRVVVANQGARNLTVGGSDCGVHLARPDDAAWLIFAVAPGVHEDVLQEIPPDEACEARVDLSSLSTLGRDQWERASVPPGDYRVVVLAHVEQEYDRTWLASAPLHVRA